MTLTPLSDADLQVSFACDEAAPACARAAIRELDPSSPVIGDAMLLVSELVTNAVRYSGCRDADRITVRARRSGAGVRIEVRDPARTDESPHVALREDHFGGMGLRLVEALSESWGVERGREQIVWAELSL